MKFLHVRQLFAVAAAVASSVSAQQTPVSPSQSYTSKPLLVSPLTGSEQKEAVLNLVSIQANGAVPMHSHPGDCIGSVLEGSVELLVEGQPTRRINAGEAYNNLRGTIHGFRSLGDAQAKLLNNLIVDKGVPRTQFVVQVPKQ